MPKKYAPEFPSDVVPVARRGDPEGMPEAACAVPVPAGPASAPVRAGNTLLTRTFMEPPWGIEPQTYALRVRCSAI